MTGPIVDETIVITGATGFIGSHLTRRLVNGNDVHILVRNPDRASALGLDASNIHDISSSTHPIAGLFEDLQPSMVFHLATRYERTDPVDPRPMLEANVVFGTAVLEAAARIGDCTVVMAGSHFQHADGVPVSLYALSKNLLIEVARYLTATRNLSWVETVLYDIYGPRDRRGKLIDTVLDRLLAGQPIQLPERLALHHFVHVDDAVDALLASARQLRSTGESGMSLFATSDKAVTPKEVVEIASTVLGRQPILGGSHFQLPPRTPMHPADGPRPDAWSPTIGLSDGIMTVARSRTAEP
ncbi:MAG: NAD(P)-dependent oxidoreductase [Acidimicrobiia bacterium]